MPRRYCIIHRDIDCHSLPKKGELKTNNDYLIDELRASSDIIIVMVSINIELAKSHWAQPTGTDFGSFAVDR